MTIALSFGSWGGVYFHRGYTWRLCLGWVALTIIPRDIDEILEQVRRGKVSALRGKYPNLRGTEALLEEKHKEEEG